MMLLVVTIMSMMLVVIMIGFMNNEDMLIADSASCLSYFETILKYDKFAIITIITITYVILIAMKSSLLVVRRACEQRQLLARGHRHHAHRS